MEKKDKLITVVSIVIIVVSAVFIANRVIATINIGDTINMQGYAITGLPLTPSAASEAASKSYVDSVAGMWELSNPNLYPTLASYNVAIGTTNAGTNKLRVVGGVTYTEGGLRIENRTTDVPAGDRVPGLIWICTDAGNDCQ